MKVEKQYLQVNKAAYMLDCSPDFIHSLIRDGKLESITMSKKATRISVQSLKKFIEESKTNPNDYYQ